jgi:hypothetical protein
MPKLKASKIIEITWKPQRIKFNLFKRKKERKKEEKSPQNTLTKYTSKIS